MKKTLIIFFLLLPCLYMNAQKEDVNLKLEQLEKRVSALEHQLGISAATSQSKNTTVNNPISKPTQNVTQSKSGIRYEISPIIGNKESECIAININATNLTKDDITVVYAGLPTLVYEDGSSYTDETGFPKVTFGSSTWGIISATLIPEISVALKIQLPDPGLHQQIKVLDFKTKPENNHGFRFTNIPIKWE